MWFERLRNKIKNFFNQYDIEEILMIIFFSIITIAIFGSLIAMFVAMINCTV
jgi:SNF family Na+-dependent transporter